MDKGNTLAVDVVCLDLTIIHVISCSAPSHRDSPTYWDMVYKNYMDSDYEFKLILGDFSVTLDPNVDALGYQTDPGNVPANNSIYLLMNSKLFLKIK